MKISIKPLVGLGDDIARYIPRVVNNIKRRQEDDNKNKNKNTSFNRKSNSKI